MSESHKLDEAEIKGKGSGHIFPIALLGCSALFQLLLVLLSGMSNWLVPVYTTVYVGCILVSIVVIKWNLRLATGFGEIPPMLLQFAFWGIVAAHTIVLPSLFSYDVSRVWGTTLDGRLSDLFRGVAGIISWIIAVYASSRGLIRWSGGGSIFQLGKTLSEAIRALVIAGLAIAFCYVFVCLCLSVAGFFFQI